MPKKRDKKSYEAEELFNSGMKLIEIASQLGVAEGTVRSWKNRYGWGNATLQKNKRNVANKTKRKRGGQPGNHNATGPPGNKHAEKHGFYSRHLPEETAAIIDEINGMDPLDVLWKNIQIQFAAIIRAQKLMYVKDQQDKTVEKVEEKDGIVIGEKWEVQQAWDKQATFLSAQSRAMTTLNGLIKQYDAMLKANGELATEEQKARIALLKDQRRKLAEKNTTGDSKEQTVVFYMPENGRDQGG